MIQSKRPAEARSRFQSRPRYDFRSGDIYRPLLAGWRRGGQGVLVCRDGLGDSTP